MYFTDWNEIPDSYYQLIYADPPWPYKDKMAGHSFSLDHEYITQPLQWIKDLPVQSIAAKDSVLLLWVPSPQLIDGLEVMRSWGYKFKTVAFVWSKLTTHGKEVANMGRWTMGNVEMVLLGTRGKPQRLARNVRQLIRAERTVHSHKPDEARRRAEQLMGDVPRIELFARGPVENWDAFGNEPDWTEYGTHNRG
jgi:N6-adenosine-specific RNA methylase IME4